MRGDHEREEFQHCDVATGKRRRPRDREAAGTPNGPKTQGYAAAADETEKKSGNGIIFGMRKKLTSAQEGKNSNHHETEVKQKESEAAIRHQDDVICTLNEDNQFLKARLLALEKSILKITYNVNKDKEPGSSVYKAKGIDKAAAFHASEQSNISNLSSINTELLNTSHDNSLARHNNNGQCNADDLNNNQIDLANDDAVFSPKQQNGNNTHKGINSNLQTESKLSTNIEGNKPRYDLSPKTSHDNSRIRYDPSLKTSHDNSLIRHNDNSQCNADDLKNNHIDLTNDDTVFFPKQQNKNNTHKGLNSNLQSESQQSINSERENPVPFSQTPWSLF